ncbi:MAG: Purine-binding protein [Fimbriimonadaceae bacterium]|nr:Purine-binding protein [Fimbriimonadaceae bacterium]
MRAWKVVVLAGLVVLGGCSGGDQSATDPTVKAPDATTDKSIKFKVALLTPGPISDAGWSAMAYEGLKQIEKELDAEVNNQEAKDAQIRDAMRAYAQQGYKLVFGHGFEYNAPAIEVAKQFPGTIFVSSSGGETADNVGAFRFYLEQGFYLAGAMAAKLSKTGTLAMIGGPDVPSIRSTFKAFKAGAEVAKPGVKVIETFTGKNEDIAAAKRATLAAIAEGADMVIHQANAAAQGVFDACKEQGVTAFGANLDQNGNPSGVVIASAVIKAGPAFTKLARDVKDGVYKGSIVLMGMDQGAIDFVIDPAKETKIPTDVLEYVLNLKREIREGKFNVPKDEF